MTAAAQDWDPFAATHGDRASVQDELRRTCPVAYSEALGWSLFRHRDVMRALEQPEVFSNAVSAHLSVPNGMDPPEHTDYRRMIERYFSADRMAAFEPHCRHIAREVIASLPDDGETDVMASFADEFALRTQCAFLNWPLDLHRPLRDWIRNNHAATRSRDRNAMAAVAFEFDRHIRAVLDHRRAGGLNGRDVASELLREQVNGRALTDEEIVSILRNWTVGELATMAASVGILMEFLANHPDVRTRLRADTSLLPRAIDEILRIDSPLMSSRRVTKCPVHMERRAIDAGERITLMWAAANRDEAAFEHPREFRWDRDPTLNLLYGAGIHACPGAPLARLELRVLMEELLASIELAPSAHKHPVRALYPTGGFSACPVHTRRLDPPH